MADVDRQYLGMISGDRARFHRFNQPLCHQALWEFALRVFVAKNRPASAGIKKALELALLFLIGVNPKPATAQTAIQPQASAYRKSATAAILIKRQQKTHWVYQVRMLLQQAPAFNQRLVHQAQFGVFQVAQATVNNSRGATGGPGGKVVLLDEQRPASRAGALPRDGNAVDPAADDDDLKAFTSQRSPDWGSIVHNFTPGTKPGHCSSA